MLTPNTALIDSLAAIHTTIAEITQEQGTFRQPDDKLIEKLPAFTRVVFTSTPGPGSYICHEIWLPDDWNGLFIGTGNGGMAGKIVYSGLVSYVRQKCAVINTDLGTSRGRSFGVNNPDVIRDFGWRATYLMTVAGKLITEAHYGKPIEHAYFLGGSTGGQQAFSLAQRFPKEYDAISAGVPAHNRLALHTYFLWNFNMLKKTGATFTVEELARISQHAVAFARENGMADAGDPFVTRPYVTPEIVERFMAYLKENDTELSEVQRTALKALYLGPINPRTGKQLYTGLPLGAEARGADARCELLGWQKKECPRIYAFSWTVGEAFTGEGFDFDADLDEIYAAEALDMNANDPDLRPFFANGGKFFIYSGSADPIVPFPETVKYYDRLVDTVGLDAALDGARYFIIPGQDHRASVTRYGDAVMNDSITVHNLLEILRLWREQGIAPDAFRMATELNGIRVEKTIHAYRTPQNPQITCIFSDDEYQR